MAAVLPNPRRYAVNGDSRYVARRARLIYDIMVKRGIVVKDYEEAAKESDQPCRRSKRRVDRGDARCPCMRRGEGSGTLCEGYGTRRQFEKEADRGWPAQHPR